MKKIEKRETDCYFIAITGDKIHSGKLEAGNELSTGMDDLEVYETEEAFNTRLNELNGA
jgi:hypothetical protein